MDSKDKRKDEQDALEILELASADLDVLTRAFKLIEEVCQEKEEPFATDVLCFDEIVH